MATATRAPAVAAAAVRALAGPTARSSSRLAGRGAVTTRADVARELAPLPVATLVAAATTASSTAAAADLWRAVGLAGARDDGQRAAAAAALVDALAQAGPSYQLRYRLFAAVTPLVDGAALRTVAAAIARLPDSPPGHALARVATRGLARNPAPAARLTLAGLVGAADAGTRLDAIRGLALPAAGGPPAATAAPMVTGDVSDAVDRALVTALGGDAWPVIRQQAAAALGLRCQRPGPQAALDRAIDADAHVPVRVEAVAARAQCETPDLDRRLWALIDGQAPLPVRDRALAAQADRPGTAAPLVTRFSRWRGQAFSDDEALRLAIRAATALGQRGATEAGPALLAAARDTAFPELAAAAVQALGALGSACPRDAPALLARYAVGDDQALALAAKGALARCR
ncbi:MAG: HEAT repeat domain-containing protein [Kofleriaceae bacterium]